MIVMISVKTKIGIIAVAIVKNRNKIEMILTTMTVAVAKWIEAMAKLVIMITTLIMVKYLAILMLSIFLHRDNENLF